MTERYPDDATLLALSADEATGVEYIPTGRSPYVLEFRRLLYRLLRAAERANDLRVYVDGDLSVGVRPGRCVIGNATVDFAGAAGLAVAPSATTSLWLAADGTVQTGTAGMPADRTTFVPLADVTADAGAITAVTDRRGEAFLLNPDLGGLGVTASAAEINQVLAGIAEHPRVSPLTLGYLTGGPDSDVGWLHTHKQFNQDVAGEADFKLYNLSSDPSANMVIRFGIVERWIDDTLLLVNLETGFLRQRFFDVTYDLIGTVHATATHEGALSASATGLLAGIVPIGGVVSDVILSVGDNLQSSDAADGLTATAKVNGTALTTTDPQLTAGDGAGFRSTAQGQGTAAVITADGTEQVSKGDLLTVDLTRTANGTVSTEASNVVVMITIRARAPE